MSFNKKYTGEDVYTMARTIYGEARGEDHDGKIAVGWVIKNRADNPRWWGSTVKEVCKKKWQFSCWNKTDPNREKLMRVELPDPAFSASLIIAVQVLSNHVADPTKGANHYHTKDISPSWIEGQKDNVTWKHGNHIFYKL